MKKKKILIPIPNYGFDPTEVSIPFKFLKDNGHFVTFATPNAKKASGDERMLNGNGLGIFTSLLKARKDALEAYKEMDKQSEFNYPVKYSEINEKDYDAILLCGGHDKAIKEYLESEILQKIIVDFFYSNKSVSAICHGVVLVSRSIDPSTKKSVLYNLKTTALLKSQELTAYNLTRLWLGDYYLTYPETTVEEEVKSSLVSTHNFISGPLPVFRDSQDDLNKGFCLKDKNYLSARWPGDIYNFSNELIKTLLD